MQAFVARHRPFFILAAVLVAQLLLLSFQITRGHNARLIRVWAVAAVDPLERILRGGVDATARAWTTYRGLWLAEQENQELRKQLDAAHFHIRQLAGTAAEAQRLRTLLELKTRLPSPSVAAEVIAASIGAGSDAIFIDKGRDAGLVPDLPVITPEGVVGKVIAVFPFTSQVLLLTDTDSGVAVLLEHSRIQGVVKGAGRNLCQLHYVMNEEEVPVGEAVVTSGLDRIYPKGLPVGTVIQIAEGNIYKTILVKPSVALNRLEHVLVLLKASAPGEPLAGPAPSR